MKEFPVKETGRIQPITIPPLFFVSCFLLPVLGNFAVALFGSIMSSITMNSIEQKIYYGMLTQFPMLYYFINILSYAVPISLMVYYSFPIYRMNTYKTKAELEKIKYRVLNLPIFSAGVGFIGWSIALILGILTFYVANVSLTDFSMIKMILGNVLYSLLCFVFIFYSLDEINRRKIIPSVFPDSKLSNYKSIKMSILTRIVIFYLTVSITPVVFLCFIIVTIIQSNNIQFPIISISIMVLFFLLLGITLTILLSKAYSIPIKEMQLITQNVSEGKLDLSIQVKSNDEIGFLGEKINEMTESLREKEFIKDTFGKVVDPIVRDHLLKGNVNLGGEIKVATILFSDIRSFTSLSENMNPGKVVELLNIYFDRMSHCITKEGGLVNKYIGDAILAIFGVPVALQNHAEAAMRAGLMMREERNLLNKELIQMGFPSLHTGIGIHTGEVLSGNIGSKSRMEYTVIGDSVNIASRLEGLCKETGKDLLISGQTESKLSKGFTINFLNKVAIRGKLQEIDVFYL
ncbi:MAG: adenylate/guanylate cyclase domain-containing protein [Leptospiraceae bacterium]|nr:adenylate/guanylate cyclase domain-containing protein [Leptospiraceae bacterium]